ncbi:hypothetical protein DW103_06495 [Parabacteroides sp. AM08-6]|nr:hypothetical protein DW103_06495 [Parabacteroides sp. AM08-6]
MKNTKLNIFFIVIALCANMFLLFDSLDLFYCYNFTNILFCFMYPEWVLLVKALLGFIGICISMLLYKCKIGFRLFLITTLVIWLIVFAIHIFSIMH